MTSLFGYIYRIESAVSTKEECDSDEWLEIEPEIEEPQQ